MVIDKTKTYRMELYDSTGAWRKWTIRFAPLKAGWFGECDYINRDIIINSRLRSQRKILLTMLHEIAHATYGPNMGELPVAILDDNFEIAVNKLLKN